MNPFLKALLTMSARSFILTVAGAIGLAQFIQPILDQYASEFGELVMGLALAVGAWVWQVYRKYKDKQKLMEALRSSQPMTEKQVEVLVKHADSFTPSVATPKNQIPV